MSTMHTERRFEEAIEHSLLATGYVQRAAKDFDVEQALFPEDVLTWVRTSQPRTWDALRKALSTEDALRANLLKSLRDELADAGSLYVLRHGFKCYGKRVRMAAFAPASGLNLSLIHI